MKLPTWVKDTAERAWWTFLATFLGAAGYQSGVTFETVNWLAAVEIAAVATIFSTIKSTVVSHIPLGEPGTASAVKLEAAGGRHRRPESGD